jgi:hypothetical protein
VAGLDLPVKLRRGLGKGNVVPANELAERLRQFDSDKDDALTEDELARFFYHNHVGGPWFCKMVAHTIWNMGEEHYAQEIYSIKADALGRVIHYTMSRAGRPSRRYVLRPEAVNGLEPKLDLDGNDTMSKVPAVPSAKPSSGASPGPTSGTTSRVEPRAAGPRPAGDPATRNTSVPSAAPRPAPRPGPRRPGPGGGPKPRR